MTAARSAFAPDMPAVVETIRRAEVDARNVVNTEFALKYAPNLVVRKRIVGETGEKRRDR